MHSRHDLLENGMSAYEHTAAFPIAGERRGLKSRVGLVQRLILLARAWHKRARDRAELARMGDLALRDIGFDKATVELEVGRAFWQTPLRAWRDAARARGR
jgi:uncharacterized protein YjiS (DUF1127 family)